ncbi:MAG TPA: RNA methyltransferase [Candidatus Saccharimonadales bacterium]|nr:RNA methyltransferase [Candidatus Saccharimonadales bacterium]
MLITSPQNPRIKELVKLKNRRKRDERKVVLIEGYRAVLSALENNFKLSEIYYCPDLYLGENETKLVELAIKGGAKDFQTTKDVFIKIAYRDRPEGIIAIAPQVHHKLEDLKVDDHSLFLVAEAIEKPGNLGTMLRSSDAARISGVIVCDPRTDVYNPNVVRASIGTLFTVPIVTTNTEEFVLWKDKHDITTLATTPSATTIYTDVDMTGRVALILGTEQVGLSDEWLEMADEKILIPMYGQADSLNVSAATTLVLFEAVRQRRLKGILS